MFVRNALKFGSFLFVLNLVDKLLLSKVKFRSIILDARYLKALLQEDKFVSLFITNAFSKEIGSDRVTFLGYLSKKGETGQMQRIHLDTREDGFSAGGTKLRYSSYNLTREGIEKLTGAHPQAVYFLLKPVKSLLDEDYISFKVIPADRMKRPIPRTEALNRQQETTLQGGQHELRALHQDSQEEERGGDYFVAATLNPSPPATSSFEEEL